MRRALIDANGVTQNIILITNGADYPLAEGWSLGDPDLYPMPDPVVPVPDTVSPRQLKLALLGAGMLDEIEAFVAQADRAVQISWEYATEFERTDALLNQMAAAFGMTDSLIDELFHVAATL